MTQKVQKQLSNTPVSSSGDVTAFLDRELAPVVRELRARFNESFGPVTTVTDSQIVDSEYQVWLVDATSAPVTLTLPSASTWPMRLYFKKKDASGNAVTIARDGSDTIDGATSVSLASQYDYAVLVSDGDAAWWRFDG